MTAVELRTRLENTGASLVIQGKRLVIMAGLFGIPEELEAQLERYRHALTAHVSLFPCTGCGRDPFDGKTSCTGCPKRQRTAVRTSKAS